MRYARIAAAAPLFMAMTAQSMDIATIKGMGFTDTKFREELELLGHQAEMVKSSPDFRKKFLEHLIDSELLAEEATKNKIYETKAYELKMSAAKRDILANLFVQSFIDKATSEVALKAYFENNAEKFSDKEVRASHILFKDKDEKKAEAVLKEALAGADFSTLAKKYSTGPSGPKGGDLNFFKKGRMVPAFDQVAFATPKNKVHDKLVRTRFGFHIIKITDIRGGARIKFEDKKQQIKRIRSNEIKEELLAKLRKENQVTIDDLALTNLTL